MDFRITVVRDVSPLQAYIKALPKKLQAACTDQAQRTAEDMRLSAPKDTTAMSESIYWIAANGRNNYNERSTQAEQLNPRITERWGGPLESIPQPEGIATAIGVAAPYAGIVNALTHPFFTENVVLCASEFPTTVEEFISGNFRPDQGPEPFPTLPADGEE